MTDLWDSVGGGLFPPPACSSCGSNMVRGKYGHYCRSCARFFKKWSP